jgi:uncharacterized protein
MEDKFARLKQCIVRYRSAVIAFSGGVDSTLLASVAGEVLEQRVLLVTVASPLSPPSEPGEARSLAARMGLSHRFIVTDKIARAVFANNAGDRCCHCKRELFSKIRGVAESEGYAVVFDGDNADDRHDYRPGRKALKELGIISPLCEAGLTKEEIRFLSKERKLPTANKPSNACLASRFPYGEKITVEKLHRVGEAESALRKLGLRQLRVRSHGDCARIEIGRSELDKAWRMRTAISKACNEAGFVFVAIDAEGYRSGAMNETLNMKR